MERMQSQRETVDILDNTPPKESRANEKGECKLQIVLKMYP